MTLGTLVHEVLEDFLAPSVASAEGFPDANPQERSRLRALVVAAFDKLQDDKNYAEPARVALKREAVERALDAWLTRLQGEAPARPLELERSFSERDGHMAFEIAIGDEKAPVRGQIDRIDVVTEGDAKRLRIVDYKSGKAYLKKVAFKESFDHATHIQVACYAIAAEDLLGMPVESIAYDYLDVNEKAKAQAIKLEWNKERSRDVVGIVGQLVESMRSGLFAPGPNCSCFDAPWLCAWGGSRPEQTSDDERWSPYRRATGLPVSNASKEVTP